ncbi:MAG: ABC-F family ATP-binding cassette domain-containing protein [Clostridia bacterium]|nr:ABC-F family ATP-binding cassette domain-containing protein [Clostridia bacterium]
MQISIINGCVEYDGEPILTEVNFTLHEKEKIALVGRNGAGKTTLLKALTGEVELIKGTGNAEFVFSKQGNPEIGYLKQTFNGREERTLEEELLSAYQKILDTEKLIQLSLEKLNSDSSEKNVREYSRLNDEYERIGGYLYKKEYKTGARKFGFTESDFSKKLCEFSGGQRTKISLLKLLLSKPQVLLLDEPTNHLDLEAIEWLENYLSEYKNAMVIVSHDRMFLDKIVGTVYEIEYGETKKYTGNYSAFITKKEEDYERAVKDADIKRKEIARLTALVERFRYKANKAKMAQAKLKQIERMGEVNDPRRFNTKSFATNFQPESESVEKALVLDELEFGYDKVLGSIDTIIKRGQKVGIIGPNGCGKSTLIKTIMGLIPSISGRALRGLRTDIGYFDQTMTQNYSPLTVFEDFHNDFPFLSDEEVRSALGAFVFSGDDVFKTIGDLSGGEKVRLALCKILKKKPNFLILDEPTNHMDIIGKDSLEKMLSNYSGTIITVSHDRYFINKVCDRLFVFENGRLNLYDCKYSEYEKLKTSVSEQSEEKVSQEKKGKPVSDSNELRKKQHRIKVLEEKMEIIGKKREALSFSLSNDPDIYSNYQRIAEVTDEINKLDDEEAPLLKEWTDLMESI